ncbi:MAG: hypothetical protein ACTSYD_03780 [Candidatus Heimdallarchaeaceae archaeon]
MGSLQLLKKAPLGTNTRGFFLLSLVFISLLTHPFFSSATLVSPHLSPNELNLPLEEEKVDIIVGKDNAIITSLSLTGGKFRYSLPLDTQQFRVVQRIAVVLVNQSKYDSIWTNRPWQFPDGLTVRISTRENNIEKIRDTAKYVINYFHTTYNVTLSLLNIHLSPKEGTLLSFVGNVQYSALQVFLDEIFYPYISELSGNLVSTFKDLLFEEAIIYGFGFSLVRTTSTSFTLERKIILGLTNQVEKKQEYYIFNTTSLFNTYLRPNLNSITSHVSLVLPFVANISFVYPEPQNVAAKATGTFEWWLKIGNVHITDQFAAILVYSMSSNHSLKFPRLAVTTSYAEQQLINNGILNMTYQVHNSGNAKAVNTTLIFPISNEFNDIIKHGVPDVPVLKGNVAIDETFSSLISVHIDLKGVYIYDLTLLDIEGWYINSTTSEFLRWNNTTHIVLNDYITAYSTNGLPSDLYQQVLIHVIPYLDEYDPIELVLNGDLRDQFLARLEENLTISIQNAYKILYSELYTNKTFFQFQSTDFAYIPTSIGNFLVAFIPELDVNKTLILNWELDNVPTAYDRFGAFVIKTVKNTNNEIYVKFRTTQTNYYDLMANLFAETDKTGKFMSYYNNQTDIFVSFGSRFVYFDETGKEYFGLSNGLNMQFADDEAILVSSLSLNETVYEVGSLLNFHLTLSNYGSIPARNIEISIMNIKLNYMWTPVDSIVLKTFSLDEIAAEENITLDFSLKANSYLGLNAYIALISFTSDYGQYPTITINPWTEKETFWTAGGETSNLVSSTLTFGILMPPKNLLGQPRPSFPVPEFVVNTTFSYSETTKTLVVTYNIKNVGLSTSLVTLYKTLSDTTSSYLKNAACYYSYNGSTKTLIPTTRETLGYAQIIYANMSIPPGGSIMIEETYYNIPNSFVVNALILTYDSEYQLYQTDFDKTSSNGDTSLPLCVPTYSLAYNANPNITESRQNTFTWTDYSSILYLSFSTPSLSWLPQVSPISLYYPMLTSGIFTILLLVALLATKIRKQRF